MLIDRFQQSLDWYLGLPVTEPGQVSRWHWIIRAPWPDHWPLAVIGVLLVALILFVIEVYRRDAKLLSHSRRGVLIGLRVLILVLVFVLLSQVSLSIDRTGLPLVVVLMDDSASMGLRDSYRDEKDQAYVGILRAADASSDAERFDLAKRIVTRDDGHWLRQLRRSHNVQVERFSADAVSIGGALLTDDDLRVVLAAIESMRPTGEITRPAEAVRQILQRTRGASPAAIVLLTDGIASSGDSDKLSVVAPSAREQLVPLFVLGFGSDEPTRDVQLSELIADDTAFVNDPIVFSAKVRAFGFSKQSTTVELRQRGSDRILATQTIVLPTDGTFQQVDLQHTATQSGDHEFEFRVVPVPGDVDPSNNRLNKAIRVREGKLRVLLADGLPRWEFRELKNTFEREPTIELHTLLQDADLEFAQQDETAKPLQGRFPLTQESLNSYDVLLLGDLSPGMFSPGMLENIREFVRAGGGVLVIAGPQHMPVAYRGSPLETLLPIELDGVKVSPLNDDLQVAFYPQATIAGRQSVALFRHLKIDDVPSGETGSNDVWKSLPGLFWLCEAPRLKVGATVLFEDPKRRGEKYPLPVIALQRFGAGKVLFHATDELWRWRFRGGERLYSQYWIQAARFLARAQALANGRGIEFTSDRQTYQRDERVTLRLQFLDESLIPADRRASVAIERVDEPRRTVELTASTSSANALTAEIRGLRDGHYHAIVMEPALPGSAPSLDFQIEAPQQELRQRRLNRADLEAAARITHGKYFSIHEADRIPDELPVGQPVPLGAARIIPLWTRWELLLLVVILLSAEWLCRRRWRLV